MANIKNLIVINEDRNERIQWNPELGQLEVREANDTTTNIILTSRPYFTVRDIRLSPLKNFLALIGDRGVTIVEMPRKLGRRFKPNQSREGQTYCKTFNIEEQLFLCERRLRIVHAAWHPLGFETRQVLCLLTNDNRLRLHDVTSDLEFQTISLRVHNESSDRDDSDGLILGLSMLSLGENAICFDFGPPMILQEPDILWPIYILMGTGDIYLIYTNFHNPTYAEHLIGPLIMLPQADDNYGADACSLIVLESSPPMLAIATPSGTIYHCFAFADSNEIFATQTLYVYESIELSRDLIENPENPYTPLPMRLFKDPTSEIRYFCVHQNGVHTVVVPLIETMQSESDLIEERESFSEFLICTRTTTPNDLDDSDEGPSTPIGLTVEVTMANISLLVLMPSLELITHRISPATTLINRKRFPRHSLDTSRDNSEQEILNISQIDPARSNFSDQVQQILKRNTSLPMLRLTEGLEQDKNIADLTNRLLSIFHNEYLKKFNLAAEAIRKKLGILEKDMRSQKEEYNMILKEKDEVYISIIALSSKTDLVRQKQKEFNARIDKVIASVSCGHPDLSEGETKLRRELEKLRERTFVCRDQFDAIVNKFKYLMSLRDPDMNNDDPLISLTQLNRIKETLSRHGNSISIMKRIIKSNEALSKQSVVK